MEEKKMPMIFWGEKHSDIYNILFYMYSCTWSFNIIMDVFIAPTAKMAGMLLILCSRFVLSWLDLQVQWLKKALSLAWHL